MAISGVFSIQNIYHQQLSNSWPENWPPKESYGYWSGGASGTVNSSVYRIAFSNDTTSSSPSTIPFIDLNSSGTGNSNFGYWGGGRGVSAVWRITFVTDTNNGVSRGSLSAARYSIATVTDGTTNGWFAGGTQYPTMFSLVDRITYSNDTATATVRGPLSSSRYGVIGVGTTDFGWITGGRLVAPPTLVTYSTVDRITFSTDSATASVRGSLTDPVYYHGGTGNSDFGYLTGGTGLSSAQKSSINRIQYTTDTATATIRGSFAGTRRTAAGTGTSAYGWFGGGYDSGSRNGRVDRIDYANDTNVAALRGALPAAVYYRDSATTGVF
jgi:hypothetical protein